MFVAIGMDGIFKISSTDRFDIEISYARRFDFQARIYIGTIFTYDYKESLWVKSSQMTTYTYFIREHKCIN